MTVTTKRLWAMTFVAILAFPVAAFFYFSLEVASGILPSTADSAITPIAASWLLSALLAPFLVAATRYAVVEATGPVSLIAWDSQRPQRSWLLSTLFLAPAALLIIIALEDLFAVAQGDRPWFSIFITLAPLLMACWLIAVRAVAVETRATFLRGWTSALKAIPVYAIGVPLGTIAVNLGLFIGLVAATSWTDWEELSGPPLCQYVSPDPAIAANQPVARRCPQLAASEG